MERQAAVQPQTAYILAGGAGRRIGADKASMLIAGKPMAAWVAAAARAAGARPVLLGGTSALASRLGCEMIPDVRPGDGPLRAFLAATVSVPGGWVFLLSCDAPLITARLLAFLASHAAEGCDAVVPVIGGRPQVALAVYSVAGLAAVRADPGAERLMCLLDNTTAVYVNEQDLAEAGIAADELMNVNTMTDFNIAAARLAARDGQVPVG